MANAWHVGVGDDVQVGRLGSLRVVGIAVAPDNVAFPLASAPRMYVARAWLERETQRRFPVDQALIWAATPAASTCSCSRRAPPAPRSRACASSPAAACACSSTRRPGSSSRCSIAFSLIALGRGGDDARGHHGGRRPAPPAGHRRAARDRLLARADRRRARLARDADGRRGRRAGHRRRGDRRARRGRPAARGAQRAAAGLGAGRCRWPARCWRSWRWWPRRRRGPRGARRRARPSPCCAAPRSRAPGACASAAASRRSGRGSRWPAAGAPRRASRCSR